MALSKQRQDVLTWADYFTGGLRGRKCSHPAYRWATGKRDPGPGYSSCADLGHLSAMLAGCRAPWVNHAEQPGGFVYGVNVNRLCPKSLFGKNPIARTEGVPQQGDICVWWPEGKPNRAHVNIMAGTHPEDGRVATYDFGQGPMAKDAWRAGADYIEAKAVEHAPAFMRNLRCFISIDDLPITAKPVPFVGEVLDAIEAETFSFREWDKK